MGLDIYVGSFTRYYAGDWETVLQKGAREHGMEVETVSTEGSGDLVTDQAEIRPGIVSWREQLSQALDAHIERPLEWDETDSAPYFTDEPSWECYSCLVLWAAYCEQPELRRPHDAVEEWRTDPAFSRSSDPQFTTAFPHLLRNVEIWLPDELPFVLRAPDPTGQDVHFGSSVALVDELEALNRRSWNASELALAEWRREGSPYAATLEIGARFAFSIMMDLARKAVAHRLMMKLDY